jgi:uncharacterized protein YwgA
MDNKQLRKIITYIVAKSQESDFALTRIRLIKLLYLIDEYYYKYKKQTLTNLDWIFHKYGPYTAQIQNTVNNMVGKELIEDSFEPAKGEIGYSYKLTQTISPDDIRIDSSLFIDAVLTSWNKKETSKILDYVYNYSLPMQGIERGYPLQFENITNHAEQVKQDHEHIKQANERFLASPRIQEMLRRLEGYKKTAKAHR